MTPEELLAQDVALRAEADRLLARSGLLEILGHYGRPHISGSYSMRLMTWRDLDLYLEMADVDVARFAQMGARVIAALSPRKASFTDHLHYPATENVVGLYWGIHMDRSSLRAWKIDIWGMAPAQCEEKLRHVTTMLDALDAGMRIAVLAIKNDVCRDPRYRDTVTSQHIYDAVIRQGARTVAEFWSAYERRHQS